MKQIALLLENKQKRAMNKICIESKLKVSVIKEGDSFIANSPALALASFGDTPEKAISNFEEAAQLFVEDCVKQGTLYDVLISCGWKKEKQQLIPPQIVATKNISMPAVV